MQDAIAQMISKEHVAQIEFVKVFVVVMVNARYI